MNIIRLIILLTLLVAGVSSVAVADDGNCWSDNQTTMCYGKYINIKEVRKLPLDDQITRAQTAARLALIDLSDAGVITVDQGFERTASLRDHILKVIHSKDVPQKEVRVWREVGLDPVYRSFAKKVKKVSYKKAKQMAFEYTASNMRKMCMNGVCINPDQEVESLYFDSMNLLERVKGLTEEDDRELTEKGIEARMRNELKSDYVVPGEYLPAVSSDNGKVIPMVAGDWNNPEDGRGISTKLNHPLMGDEQWLTYVFRCSNQALKPPVPKPPEVPPPVHKPPEEGLPPAVVKKAPYYVVKLQVEDSLGIYHGATANADWKGAYAEGVLYGRFGKDDEYAAGLGALGRLNFGRMENSPYRWHEGSVGGELAFRDDYWDEDHHSTGVALKPRGLHDWVSGRNKQSGYKMSQTDVLLGGYLEGAKRLGPRWLVGAQLEGYAMVGASQKSTWVGDKPQDRSSVGANIFAEYFLTYGQSDILGKYWLSVRGNLGANHQFWDNQSIAPISAQLRLGTKDYGIIGCGVQVGLPLGRAGQYRRMHIPWKDLVSLTEFCSYNYGGIVHRLDNRDREDQVEIRQQPFGKRDLDRQDETVIRFDSTQSVSTMRR